MDLSTVPDKLDGILAGIAATSAMSPSMDKVAAMLCHQADLLHIWDALASISPSEEERIEALEIVSDLQSHIWVQA